MTQPPPTIGTTASALLVAGAYALVAALWIVFSDSQLASLASDADQLSRLQTVKGWFFVGVTATLLFLLMRWRLGQLAASQQTALANEARLRSILNSIDDLVFVIDADGRLVDCYQPAAATLLLAPERFIGRRLDEVGLPAEVVAQMLAAIDTLRQGSGVVSIEYVLELALGRCHFEARLSRQQDASGAFAGVTAVARDISARRRAEEKLLSSELSYRALLDNLPNIAVQGYDRERRIIFWNETSERLYGYARDEVLGRQLEDTIIPPALRATVIEAHRRWITDKIPIAAGEIDLLKKDGSLVPVYSSHSLIYNSADEPEMFCLDVDLAELRQAQGELRLAACVFDGSTQGILIADRDTRIIAVNEAFTRITGYARAEAIGQRPQMLASGLHTRDFYRAMWDELRENGHWQGEIWNRRKNGEPIPEWLGISAVRDDAGELTHYIGIFADISEKKSFEARLQHLTHHDLLTGLPNRLLLQERFEQARAFAARDGQRVALLVLDLDHFKEVNDNLGHALGDRLLVAIAGRLQACVRDTDTVSRQGGDEFLISLNGIHDSEAIAGITDKIMQTMAPSFTLDGQTLSTSFSIGIAAWPEDGEDFATLLLKADTAMYQAKESGRNVYRFFDERMNADRRRRLQLQNGLRGAVERGEMDIHYQPQIDLASGTIIGAEALLRWNSSEFGNIPPTTFIPLAEQSGSIIPIGEWVLQQACRQAEIWRKSHPPGLTVAVNLSVQQFRRSDPVALVGRALAASGLPAHLLELEITESMLISNVDEVLGMLHRLKALGVRLAIDDFGTGYSSLSYLRLFPIDKLKIDQSFVRDIVGNPSNVAIIRVIIELGRILRMRTIAEGVEEAAHADFLREAGCDDAQGYLFGRPMPVAQFDELLATASAAVGSPSPVPPSQKS
jgi:diguanylate cyclase (GGDEF)-like protein/PAS domain S-box-containing protein